MSCANAHWEQTYGQICDHAAERCMFPYGSSDGEYKQVSAECQDCGGRMKKCPNWHFCHTSHPVQLMNCWGGRCLSCDMTFGRNLVFVDTNAECSICMEYSMDRMVFPGCGNNHTFCISCVKRSMFGSYAQVAAICEEVNSEEKNQDDEYDSQSAADALKRALPTITTCPLCRASSLPPWAKHTHMCFDGRKLT